MVKIYRSIKNDEKEGSRSYEFVTTTRTTYLHEKVNSVLMVCQPLCKNQIKSFLIIRYPTAPLKKHEIVSYFVLNIVFIFKIFLNTSNVP